MIIEGFEQNDLFPIESLDCIAQLVLNNERVCVFGLDVLVDKLIEQVSKTILRNKTASDANRSAALANIYSTCSEDFDGQIQIGSQVHIVRVSVDVSITPAQERDNWARVKPVVVAD
ncbi:hypothetical protein NZD89_12200 [Alicyclobacillus fastidiosus]|uniref:Uncharacterized protein n=1 Tax=Alicyclobacillus fastidiosus TaxID=392011 RepID=A0ABY6ZMB7_9BACL|nr:hypothetical protein [Alicyclobacillus fastidiosus]WAH44068.1 hypothetical protein NZD89_12200 [Alicyclobacillus fastidiosus]GMA60354.1 hypothetical protein GCM10025859_07940 [Alicyclobacillus fastidiosus]